MTFLFPVVNIKLSIIIDTQRTLFRGGKLSPSFPPLSLVHTLGLVALFVAFTVKSIQSAKCYELFIMTVVSGLRTVRFSLVIVLIFECSKVEYIISPNGFSKFFSRIVRYKEMPKKRNVKRLAMIV